MLSQEEAGSTMHEEETDSMVSQGEAGLIMPPEDDTASVMSHDDGAGSVMSQGSGAGSIVKSLRMILNLKTASSNKIIC